MHKVTMTQLNSLLEKRKIPELKVLLHRMKVQDVAHFISKIEETDLDLSIVVFRLLSKDVAAEVFSYLDKHTQRQVVNAISTSELNIISKELYLDDFVDLLEEMPANMVKKILRNTDKQRRELVNEFLKYKDDSAGSIMTVEFVTLKEDLDVAQAIKKIRKEAPKKETINVCYVLDSTRKLVGVVSLAKLVLSPSKTIIRDIMDKKIITAITTEDQEEVAKKFTQYDLLAMPVVDKEYRMVGIITVDDIIDIIKEEATEDMVKMVGIENAEKPYFKTSAFELARNRILWLLLLMLSSMLTGAILESYEAAFAAIPLLVTFIPMLTGTGGNCGSQSSTIIIRGMSVGEITPKDAFKVMWKEFRVSLIVGVALSIVNFVRILIFNQGEIGVAIVVSIAIFLTVIMAKLVGCLLPIGAKMCKLDPAIMAAPLITTIIDAASLVLYFTIAVKILSI